MMLDADGLVGPWQYGQDGQVGAKLMRWSKKNPNLKSPCVSAFEAGLC